MIPKAIRPYLEITQQIKDRDNNVIITGILTCCNSHDFEVFVAGKIKYRLFSKMFLYPENDKTIFEVRCKKCGKIIPVFNSSFDGYGQCEKKQENMCVPTQLIDCIKCRSENFSVIIKYEYPDVQELREIETSDRNNAFTWIWIALKCNQCGTRYENFVDCETT